MLKFESDYERLSNKDILLKLGLKKKLLVSLSREGGEGVSQLLEKETKSLSREFFFFDVIPYATVF